MSDFLVFKQAVKAQLDKMCANSKLYHVSADNDTLWELYLNSFPEGTNEIFRERGVYDCQCCKGFIKNIGSVVAIIDNELVSIWDFEGEVCYPYNIVAKKMSEFVKRHTIYNVFFNECNMVGANRNTQLLENGDSITFDHFYYRLPNKFVKTSSGSICSEMKSKKDVTKRGLEEITIPAIETVLELINQNSLYRGEEFQSSVAKFLEIKKTFDIIEDDKKKDNFCWVSSSEACIRNSVIGTLLVDLSNDVGLNKAVGQFESKVAPMNYKRTSALVTPNMIRKAQEKVVELGIEDSLARRYAVAKDLTINNVLFADRSIKKSMNVFDEMIEEAPSKVKNLDKIEKVSIDTFIKGILPKVNSIELMLENRHSPNFMSLIAPQNADAKPIFKWDNNFSWSYKGEVADSIKEKVKRAGGNVEGVIRCSLSWYNYDDLDIHVIEPSGNEIYYRNHINRSTTGRLDVDMNAGSGVSRNAVENITWTDKNKMEEGVYKLFIHQFAQRETIDAGFEVEIEYDGRIYTFEYDKIVKNNVNVAEFSFSREQGVRIIKSLPANTATKEIWGVPTHTFQKVSMVVQSPNHWDSKAMGNKHWFFIMDKCKNTDSTKGFYNEFLRNDLMEHRKTFEVLSNKMKVNPSDEQLSGLGFSSTQRNEIICKVNGNFTRMIKLIF